MGQGQTDRDNSRILVATNDPEVRNVFRDSLKAQLTVTEAISEKETLKLLRSMHFQVLVWDLDMPGSDGFGLLKVVRTEHPGMRVLAVSGHGSKALLDAAQYLGATRGLRKSSAPRVMVKTVRKLLGDPR